ncbi:MAG: T9SS type A sorting domain-containing protein, partial [Bacteroidales bacterium]|nr:T9SS type A sorting domain-containing protein [Bacteroidales bacterium]
GSTDMTIDLTGQPAGLYLIRASYDGQKTTLKLVLK